MQLTTFEQAGELASVPEAVGLSKDVGVDGLYEAVGAGQIAAEAIATRLGSIGSGPPPPREQERGLFTRVLRRMTRGGRRSDEGLGAEAGSPIVLTEELVQGAQGRDATVTLASCCSPVPGDPLVAFFEPGRGIVAHVQGCPEALEQLSQRKVHLAWAEGLELDRPVTLEVRTANTVGLLAEMSRAFSHHGVNIKQANCRAYGDGDRALNTVHASVSTLPQLQSLVSTLKNIDGVIGVERVFTRGGSGVYPQP
jgi:GTP pyrophosphokinase